jgi:hypothetical protein
MGLPGAAPQAMAAPAAGGTDHALVSGHLAVGYLGRSSVQVGLTGTASGAEVAAPIIGVRYWLNPQLGLDLGLGFGIDSGSTETPAGDADLPSHWAILLHAGVPLALASGRHYTFEIIPEANVGFGSGSAEVAGVDESSSGFALDLGARAGAEIQFGFMGLPELALQGTIGALFSIQSASTTLEAAGGDQESSQSNMLLRTTVNNSPWNIFTSNVAALYYF